MKPLKRLVFVILFIPTVIFGSIRWIISGEETMSAIDKLEDWCDN